MPGATILGNKFIFQRGFTLPLTLTLVHMLTQSILAVLTIDVLKAVEKVPVLRPDYTRKVLPIAVVFCANIVLGNISLRFLPVSFMQVRSLDSCFRLTLSLCFILRRSLRDHLGSGAVLNSLRMPTSICGRASATASRATVSCARLPFGLTRLPLMFSALSHALASIHGVTYIAVVSLYC